MTKYWKSAVVIALIVGMPWVPETFLLKVDRSGGLNNFSARFWDDRHGTKEPDP